MQYTTDDLRKKWLDFWAERDHAIIPSAGVLPDNDPTALFHNSGMHPLVPYLMGEAHPQGKRLADFQKCIRTADIEDVGDATHLTFFEMLGNWSLGDYFKAEQIPWSFEFLTETLELPLERLAVSVFAGSDNAERDEESANLWKSLGIPENRIGYLGEDNWWKKGDTGPCGPCTEMHYWTGDMPAPESYQDTWEDPRWVEIWNDVFMQFNKEAGKPLVDLPAQNIDTGMGMERTVAVLNGMTSVYETDAFMEIFEQIAALASFPEILEDKVADTPKHNSARIIADHIRTAVIILGDKVSPSNVDQGYILRRMIRRAVRHGRKLGVEQNLCVPIAEAVIGKLGDHYPELRTNTEFILNELDAEEKQFRQTLEKGERVFEKKARGFEDAGIQEINGGTAFDLYQTYGFPIEMTQELAAERGFEVDLEGYEAALKAHQEKSRAGSAEKFAGGLTGEDTEAEKKLHTATHLMNAALKKFIGEHVEQRGANITPQRLRFDFSHEEKLTPEEVEQIENYVNEAIAADVEIGYVEMPVQEALDSGAIGAFLDRYGDIVKVYEMGEWSREICGGPHADRTGELGRFKIKKQESCGRGVRRIKAVLITE